ncbi:MAG: (Fe-S)-binding protein [bacterium]
MRREEIIEDIYTCARCGYCRFGCPVYGEIGFERATVRGRMLLFKKIVEGKLPYNGAVKDLIYMCAQCENCKVQCPTGVDFVRISIALKEDLMERGELPQHHQMLRSNLVGRSNPFGEPREERGSWIPKNHATPKKSKYLYFAGCVASYSVNRIGRSIVKILDDMGFDFTTLGSQEYCCGGPLFRLGDKEEAKKLIMRNVNQFEEYGVKTVFASCAGCFRTMKHTYPKDFEILHVTQLFDQLIQNGDIQFKKPLEKKIMYFDGCDLGRHSGVYEEPRNILRAIPGVELMEFTYNREEATCCGGPLASSFPEIAHKIAAKKVREAADRGADMIVTACGTCLVNFKEGAKLEGASIEIQDLPMLLPGLVK